MFKLIQKEKKLFIISLVFLFVPLFFLYIYTQFNPDIIYSISSEYQASTMKRNFNPELNSSRISTDFSTDISMLKFYIINNAGMGLGIFIAGLLLGAGSLLLLAYQGVSMGILIGYVAQLGYGENLWPYIIGHSSVELLAAVFSAVGGLIIGRSLLKPDQSSRVKSFIAAFIASLAYIIVAVLFFVLAAIIETFWSPNINISSSAKYVAGSVLWLSIIYLFYAAFNKRESL